MTAPLPTLFVPRDREALARRLAQLEPVSPRRWGSMDPVQMLDHCAAGLEVALGDRPARQTLLGRLVTPLILGRVLGPHPFRRNLPTEATWASGDPGAFEAQRLRLATLVDRFVQRGPEGAETAVHPFFGRLGGARWGRLTYKHLDHHLRQFGV